MDGSMDWCNRARQRLVDMETLIAQGRGGAPVDGGGCTEPGGGIVPTTRTAAQMADLLRSQLTHCPGPVTMMLGDVPVVGFGQAEAIVAPAVAAPISPWGIAVATSIVGAATGWLIEEFASTFRQRRRDH